MKQIMTQKELEQFKQIVESDLISHKLNEVEKEDKSIVIAALFDYLLLTKDYENIELYLNTIEISSPRINKLLLPREFLVKKNKMSDKEANAYMYNHFIHDGYLYHVTKSNHLDSILENGLVSLNKRFNEKLYEECIKVNKTFNTILKRTDGYAYDLIKIPNYEKLYQERFNSVYLSTNLSHALTVYGGPTEILDCFLNRLFHCLLIGRCCMDLPKEELKDKIITGMKRFKYQEQELQTLIDFYDKLYEPMEDNEKLENKSILLVANNNITDNTENYLFDHEYNKLIQYPEKFSFYYKHCIDIECTHDIKPKDLIAITIEENNSLKVHKKGIDHGC